ncbi:MAG: 50S ribosomal protein L29 [Trichodesmium sp. St16_bin4-tuft]|nr:50S ribosomal protein L29 [Trichodesmium sp. MAG_R01]MDE5070259.1 50S ribosomal protein L29 [Trichodesmium sp. St4_bin8_1]MDE5071480.1 50S ribosomal protein L29 [Trichodesmium sp. St5_bin8]MDE5078475.1 50S ribosomal protein L29 [Trichodesmium sp. St2_bin6]MDE5090498.1 50S ribosomal protein L29 [Trichodesmium sp. St18_bin3_1_1]MDE5098763.1 50S ribosomal protein L29 [Trichodesmium sp. St16_bin4-tuft]
MSFPKIAEVRELSDEELANEIAKVKRELFDLRILKATGRIEKTHLFKHNRHRLAQLLTIEKERELAKNAEAYTTVSTVENTK